jgi:photosystem II stability/assembly factor-like uncharacterized protein
VVAFDRKHRRALLQSVAVSGAGCAVYCLSAVTVNVSRNQGRTFGPTKVIYQSEAVESQGSVVFNDKSWIAVDNHPKSPHYGRAYAAWDQVRCSDPQCDTAPTDQPVLVSHSDNGGRTWSRPVEAADLQPGSAHQSVGALPLVLPNGHVVIVYADATGGVYTFAGRYAAMVSTDGGRKWSAPAEVAKAQPYAEEGNRLRAPNIPAAAVSGNGTIWVAFQDQRFGSGRNDIVLTHSADEGKTWSDPINATPNETDLDHFTPAIAVRGRTVYVTYRTHQPGPVDASPMVGAVYRAVRGGKTIAGPIDLFKPSDATAAAFTTGPMAGKTLRFFGDYAAIAVGGLWIHPIWGQSGTFPRQKANPTDTHERAYSARIHR